MAVPTAHHHAESGKEGEYRQGHIQGSQAVAAHSRPHKEHICHTVEGMGDLSDEGGEQIAEVITLHLPAQRPGSMDTEAVMEQKTSLFSENREAEEAFHARTRDSTTGQTKKKVGYRTKNPGKYLPFLPVCTSSRGKMPGRPGDSVKLHKAFPAPARSGKNSLQ